MTHKSEYIFYISQLHMRNLMVIFDYLSILFFLPSYFLLVVRYNQCKRLCTIYFTTTYINNLSRLILYFSLLFFVYQLTYNWKNTLLCYYYIFVIFTDEAMINIFPQGLCHLWGCCWVDFFKERKERKIWEEKIHE